MVGPGLTILLGLLISAFQLELVSAGALGNGSNVDWVFCTPSNQCGIGGGDCDENNDCKNGLICGENNCKTWHPQAHPMADCCMEDPNAPKCTADKSDSSCCNSNYKCGVGEGDCDKHADCKPGLVCLSNNCKKFDPKWGSTYDCCAERERCTADKSDSSCCTSHNKCGVGEGDCDKHTDCKPGLFCLSNNCKKFDPKWGSSYDCCAEREKCTADKSDSSCCTSDNPCPIGEGDCDKHTDCKPGLVCGSNNCDQFDPKWGSTYDCCTLREKCTADKSDSSCCTSHNKCGEGEGDCDKNTDCMPGLVCGSNNCKQFDPKWGSTYDCCTEREKCTADKSDSSCCTSDNKCGVGEGDCDKHTDCKPGLVCGSNNCKQFDPKWGSTYDCCAPKQR